MHPNLESLQPVHGRFAPSPTGLLHVGGARTALVAWLSARSAKGRFTLRIEDLDPPRVEPGAAQLIMDDLAWLDLDFDASPSLGGPHAPYCQSECSSYYGQALEALHKGGWLFPCRVSRRELRTMASAPHGPARGAPYPASLRPRHLAPQWFDDVSGAAIRFMVPDREVSFTDRLHGIQTENVSCAVGDFVLRRRDDLYAYQLAVVVDDLRMGITEVVRGEDLLSSTARQILLVEALGGTRPAYAHVPLVLTAAGKKLSKRDADLTVAFLRDAGIAPEAVVGYLAWSLGIREAPDPISARALIADFCWSRIRSTDPWHLPPDLANSLCDRRSSYSG